MLICFLDLGGEERCTVCCKLPSRWGPSRSSQVCSQVRWKNLVELRDAEVADYFESGPKTIRVSGRVASPALASG